MSIKSATIEGLDELIKAFEKLPDEALPFARDGANEAGAIVLSKAQQKVPVDTGNLKSKLKLSKAKSGAKSTYKIISTITTSKGAAYMVPLELGHRIIINKKAVGVVKERPFLRPAADESKEEVVSTIAKALNKALEQMGGKK